MELYYQKKSITLRKLKELSINQDVESWLIGTIHARKECINFERTCIKLVKPEFILAEQMERIFDNHRAELEELFSYLPKFAKEFGAKYINCDTSNNRTNSAREFEMGKNICKYINQSKKPVLVILGAGHLEPRAKNLYKGLEGKVLLVINPLEILDKATKDKEGYVEARDFLENDGIVKSYNAIILKL